MRGHGIKIGALALLAATGWASMASAQTPDIPTVVSPLRVESDHNNVNLVSGRTSIDGPVLSVPAAPNLRFDRVQNAAPYVRGTITGPPGGPFTGSYSVHAGGAASESFTCPDLDCASVTGTGSTLQPSNSGRGPAVYRQAGSGVRYQFSVLHVSAFGSPNSQMLYYASTAIWPNGESITYSYDTAYLPDYPGRPYRRPNRLQSNLGYHITISYRPGELGTSEWNSPSQATLYADAAPTVPLQQQTYSADGGTITDLGGRVYSCANCRNSMGADIAVGSGSLTLPGEGAPALQVTASTQAGASPAFPIVGSVTRDGVTWNYSYGNLSYDYQSQGYWYDNLTITGPNGFHNFYEFATSDRRNVMTRMTDSLGRVTNYTFDAAYRPTRIFYPEGNEVGVTYDPQGNIIERRAKARPGTGLSDIVQTLSYPDAPGGIPNMCHTACWRPLWSRDALNRQTDYLYNANGQLTQQDDPADANGVRRRTITAYALSPNGQINRRSAVRLCGVGPGAATTCGTNQEHLTEYEYWGNTMLPSAERRIDASSGTTVTLTTTYSYDSEGRLISADGPMSGDDDTIYNRYDLHGRRTWEIGARGPGGVRIATRTSYRDSDDKVTSTETGTLPDENSTSLTVLRRTDLDYDSRRNAIRESLIAAGNPVGVVQRTFDDRARPECQAQRMNPAIFGSLPTSACTPGATGTQGPDRITRTVYDAASQRLQLREGVGSAEEGTEATWAYNLNGQITTVIDGNGNRAELRYDGHMRQDRWTFPSATRASAFNDATSATALSTSGSVNAADYEQYGYDANGNRTSFRKRDGSTLTYTYDNLNRMLVKVVPERPTGPQALTAAQTRDVYYSYDLRNLQLSARFDSQSGEGLINVYDGFGRLTSSRTDVGGTTRTLAYEYDNAGNRTRITHPDGPHFRSDYDTLNRPDSIWENGVTNMSGFTYYSHGAASGLSRANGTATGYGYDSVQRLSGMVQYLAGTAHDATWGFGRNPAGGISSVSRNNNAYAWTGHYATTRAYTTNGLNQYSQAGGTSLIYDANGNLTASGSSAYVYDIENRLVGATGGVVLSYDPLGRLHQVSSTAGPTTQFLYDGDALVGEYVGGTMTRRFVHNVGADVPLLSYAGSNLSTPSYLHADERGSIVALSDISGNGTINSYDEYGIPGAGNTGRFQYTGQIWLAELGMYHYKARIYSPYLGRFLQTDPIGYDDQYNLYAYVGNDPVNLSDPTGMACSTGSLTADSMGHDATGCKNLEGFEGSGTQRPRQFTGEARAGGNGQRRLSEDTREVLADPNVRRQINNAWRRSGGNGPSRRKREYGFWVTRTRHGTFAIGRLVPGSGPNIRYDHIQAERPEGATIFIHVHPYRSSGDHPFVRSIAISQGDRTVASGLRALVISVARPEPSTGPNAYGAYVDETDYRR